MNLLRRFAWVIIVGLGMTQLTDAQRPIPNPQLMMIGARNMSLGVSNPALKGDINGIFINPAVLGSLDAMPLAISSQKIMGFFDNKFVAGSFPIDVPIPLENKEINQKVTVGLAFGSTALDGIPKTIQDNDVIRKVGEFGAGFNIIGAAAGTQFFDIYGFDDITFGTNLKAVQQYIGGRSRLGFGIDLGTSATYHQNTVPYVGNVYLGGAIHNFLSTGLKWPELGDEAGLPFEFYVGAGADLFDEQLHVFLNNGPDGIAASTEYQIQSNMFVRGSTNFKTISIGTGLIFDAIAGVNEQNYSVRLDYNYTQHTAPFDADPTHAISLSVLGEARPRTPRILVPREDITTQERYTTLKGIGPKNISIRIYNNNSLTRTINSDRNGEWEIDRFPLREGKNEIYIQAFSINRDSSPASDKIVVTSDTRPPLFDVKIYPDDDSLRISVAASESLSILEGAVEDTKLLFIEEEDDKWYGRIPLPETLKDGSPVPESMQNLQLFGTDTAGNQTPVVNTPFFVSLEFPQDKFVHYKENLRFIGQASDMVQEVLVQDQRVPIDNNNNFSVSQALQPGKNLVNLKVRTHMNKTITHALRVLYLVSFPDIQQRVRERREIEFLSTLGLLEGEEDGNFYPEREVTREWITRLMVKAAGYELKDVEDDLFVDVPKDHPNAPYIQAAILSGLIFAYPDGTFKAEQPLTLTEAIFLLSNAGIIDEEPTGSDENTYIKRRELAQYLAYTPKYELLIERLIDWEKGYNK